MSHAEHCDCERCQLHRRVATDEAQHQTLALFDELDRIRRRLRLLQSAVNDEINAVCVRISELVGVER